MLVTQSCLTLSDPMNCSLPDSPVHRIFQARIQSGLPLLSPGDLPDPGIEPGSPTLQADPLISRPTTYKTFFFLIIFNKISNKNTFLNLKNSLLVIV